MRDKFLKLTNAAYKLFEFFPESDPLKNRAKDRALAIMDGLSLIEKTSGWVSFQKDKTKANLSEDIDALLGYLWIAKSQKWLNSVNYLIIANEYEKIKKEIEPIAGLEQKLPDISALPAIENSTQSVPENLMDSEAIQEPNSSDFTPELKTRQKKILDFLKNHGKAQVMDLQMILPDITKRTIRRDLDELLEAGKIIRLGEFNQVFYKISGNQIFTS